MANDPRFGPLKIGETLLMWQIRGLLGQGGHAWVYHGYDSFLDREVAIKVIPTPPPGSEPERDMRARAQREARVLSQLENENVVRLIAAGFTSDGAVYIVMEILRGRTLREVIGVFGRLNVVEALSLALKIADGVHAAHGLDVIHRDLKPENVFVIERNGVKVLDFGIAKLFGAGAATTQRNFLIGTIKYMSPEHLLGDNVTIRSDIYALGTILYELLSGRIPCMIGIQDPTNDSLMYAQLNRMPPMLDELVPSVPNLLALTVHRMIAKDPKDRFESMAEVVGLLGAHLKTCLEDGSAPAARELWRAVPPRVTAFALSHATTEIHEVSTLAPPTAPPVTLPTPQAQDTTPVSKPPFSQPKPGVSPRPIVQVTEPIRVAPASPSLLAQAPAAVAAPASVVEPRRAPPPAAKSTVEASVSRSRAALQAPPSAPQAPPSDRSRPPRAASAAAPNPTSARPARAPSRPRATQPKPKESWNLLTLGLPLGTAAGLIAGLGMYWHPQRATTSTEEPVAIISAQPARLADAPRPPGNPTAPTTAPDPAASPTARTNPTPTPAEAAPRPAPAAPAFVTAPKILPAVAAPTVQVAHAATKPTPKPQAPTTHGGLWDMSDLDTPTQPKPASPNPVKHQTKAIYGDDPVVR